MLTRTGRTHRTVWWFACSGSIEASVCSGRWLRSLRSMLDNMCCRFLTILTTFVFTLFGQTAKIPRALDGHPDLQGIWTNATLTRVERPQEFETTSTVADADARAYETKEESQFVSAARVSDAEVLFIDRGLELVRIGGVKRTSLIVDPPDGKVPFRSPAVRKLSAELQNYIGYDSDNVKARPLPERCLIGVGASGAPGGPPMMPVLYNNNYQIVQTADHVVILVEMVHDARIVRMNNTHPLANVRQWFGDSIGYWEGETLVVDTTNFTNKTRFYASSETLHVVERFTRTDANTILYRATMDDPATFSKPWTVEFPLVRTIGPIYEYACHEGNYALSGILGGAREREK